MRWFCIHRWSLWSNVYWKTGEGGGAYQDRYCTKCRKAETRAVR